MATLHLTRQQYRDLSEVTKAYGMALNLSTYKRMGNCWGSYSPWAMLVCIDTTADEPKWHERGMISLSSSINADQLRSAGRTRPEIDWGVLSDEEIYQFIVWHEIGHRMDNFDFAFLWTIKDHHVRDECHRRSRIVNEVLADRFAWQRIRPGEPIPLSDQGRRMKEQVGEDIEYLDAHAQRTSSTVRPLSPGQYHDVPEYMLATRARAAFIGPEVSRSLLVKRIQRHKGFAEQNGRTLY